MGWREDALVVSMECLIRAVYVPTKPGVIALFSANYFSFSLAALHNPYTSLTAAFVQALLSGVLRTIALKALGLYPSLPYCAFGVNGNSA